jgi:hypothetical protein
MAGWDYVIGETAYDRPFVFFEKGAIVGFNATGVTSVTLTIKNADLSPTGITNVLLAIDTPNPLRAFYFVNALTPNIPQQEGSYLVTFTVNIAPGTVRKTFELDLRVFNG